VSFAELDQKVEGFRGPLAMELVPNIFLWTSLSEEAADAIDALRAEGRITLEPACWLTYFMDRCVLSLPIAKRPTRRGYKKPHWLPVCLRPCPKEMTR
jgi:hypothetical protein